MFNDIFRPFIIIHSSSKWQQKVQHGMRWLLDYLVNFYFIYFLLHVAELSFCFQFFSFNCNFDFFYQWQQIIKWNAVLFTKKLRCGWVMMNNWLIMSGLRLVRNYSFSNWSIGTYVENYFILTFHAKHNKMSRIAMV